MAKQCAAAGLCVALTATSCGFGGVNTLPLPGAVASGSGNSVYHVQIANVGTLESNSPVMIDDVVVGSVGKLGVHNWVADVEVRVRPDVAVPANAVATIGQTSLLGSMHVALDPPLGEPPSGRLQPGSTIALNRSSTYPSTEQTLSSLSVVVNAGGLGQIGDFIHSTATALSGREGEIRELITRLDTFVGTVDEQRDRFNASIQALDRLTNTLAAQKDDITDALRTVPPALDVLLAERARFVTAMQKLGEFSDIATELVNTTQDDLVKNLTNLEPTLKALADVGPYLGTVLALVPSFPFPQNFIDRAIRGDYINIFATIDLTYSRLKRSLLLGTRWGDPNAPLIPAPGDPAHLNYTYEPLNLGVTPPPEGVTPPPPSAPSGARPGTTSACHTARSTCCSAGLVCLRGTVPARRRGQLMLTRLVRTQLIIFAIASVIGVATMVFGYMGVPTWLGVGHIKVTVELPGTGGLYRFGNVTYRGVQMGKVVSVTPTATGATAELSLKSSPKIPADVQANVRSVSAVGEQYVDLIPQGAGPPFLAEGSVIERADATIPQKVGPVLDQLSALVKSVPEQKLSDLLDESFLAFNGAGYDVGSLLDSGSRIAADSNATAERTRTLIDDSAPLLDSQAESADSLRNWARSLAAVTDQIVDNDPDLRTILDTGPGPPTRRHGCSTRSSRRYLCCWRT